MLYQRDLINARGVSLGEGFAALLIDSLKPSTRAAIRRALARGVTVQQLIDCARQRRVGYLMLAAVEACARQTWKDMLR